MQKVLDPTLNPPVASFGRSHPLHGWESAAVFPSLLVFGLLCAGPDHLPLRQESRLEV